MTLEAKNKAITTIEPPTSWASINLTELWEYRELLYFLIWRDIKIKYKQSIFGIGWAVFQPLLSMLVYTLIFNKIAKIYSNDIPFPLFVLSGVVIWNYFSQSIISGTSSLVQNKNLISKVYFPRLVIPLASVGGGVLDFLISCSLLILLFMFYSFPVKWTLVFVPLAFLFTLYISFSFSLWASAICVKYRDLPHTIPFLVQILFWLSPVAYTTQTIPEQWKVLFVINPMYGVIELFRWSCFGVGELNLEPLLISCLGVSLVFVTGLKFFKKMERDFSDLI